MKTNKEILENLMQTIIKAQEEFYMGAEVSQAEKFSFQNGFILGWKARTEKTMTAVNKAYKALEHEILLGEKPLPTQPDSKEKNCATCYYEHIPIDTEPCTTCFWHDNPNPNWQPKEKTLEQEINEMSEKNKYMEWEDYLIGLGVIGREKKLILRKLLNTQK